MHASRYWQLRQGENEVPTVYYEQKTLLLHDIPITAAIACLYAIFAIISKSLVLLLCVEFIALVFVPKGERLNQTEVVEPLERDINPTQASSNTESDHQQNHDAGFAFVHYALKWIEDAAKYDTVSIHDASNRIEDAADSNSISDTNNSSRWIHKDRIGSGGFGVVFTAENRETKAIGAVKVLKDYHVAANVESMQKEIKFLRRMEHPNIIMYFDHEIEIKFLRRMEHPNIIMYFDHEIVGRDIYLYMEYIQPGSLGKIISEQCVLHEPLIRKFTAQILSGLVYLHSKRVVHRDIKPDNILVGPNNTIKLADFGLAKHLQHSVGNHSKLGTYPYAAPEVLQNKEYNSSPEAFAADIWSLGCVIIEMFTGKIPWSDSKMKNPGLEELCLEGKDFLERCFKENPDERASAKELLGHPFVRGIN